MLCFLCFFLIIIIIFCHPVNCGIWNTNRAYLRKVTGITRLVYVSLLLYLFQSTSLLIYNSPRTPYGSMNSWYKYCMNIVWKRWRILIVGAKSSQDAIDELLWMVLLFYTQLYMEFSCKINQISGNIHTKLGTLLAWITCSISQGIHHSMISYPRLPSIHQSIYVWFCICSSCWQYLSDFQYHDCHGLNTGRSVDSLEQQKHSGILVARYPRIYKEITICDPDTNLKAKPNRNTIRFRLHRYHVPVDVTMISIALPISSWSRELRYQDRTEELLRSSVFFVHQFTAVLLNSITDSGIT